MRHPSKLQEIKDTQIHNFRMNALSRHLTGQQPCVRMCGFADTMLPEAEELLWEKQEYKKGDKVSFINTDFIDWLDNVNNITIHKHGLLISREQGKFWGGLIIPYRSLNILPGRKYEIIFDYSPLGERRFDEGPWDPRECWPRLQVICSKSYAFTDPEWFKNRYSMNVSTGNTPPGSWEQIYVKVDFTGMDKIPGCIRTQTLPRSHQDDYLFGYIKVRDLDTKEEVYYNNFRFNEFIAAENVSANNNELPGISKQWDSRNP